MPISALTTEIAQNFVDLLPDSIFLPSVSPDNDGGYTFEWMEDREFILSISIIDEYLIYAGIFGDYRLKGKTRIQNELPKQIIKPLQEFFTKTTLF